MAGARRISLLSSGSLSFGASGSIQTIAHPPDPPPTILPASVLLPFLFSALPFFLLAILPATMMFSLSAFSKVRPVRPGPDQNHRVGENGQTGQIPLYPPWKENSPVHSIRGYRWKPAAPKVSGLSASPNPYSKAIEADGRAAFPFRKRALPFFRRELACTKIKQRVVLAVSLPSSLFSFLLCRLVLSSFLGASWLKWGGLFAFRAGKASSPRASPFCVLCFYSCSLFVFCLCCPVSPSILRILLSNCIVLFAPLLLGRPPPLILGSGPL